MTKPISEIPDEQASACAHSCQSFDIYIVYRPGYGFYTTILHSKNKKLK